MSEQKKGANPESLGRQLRVDWVASMDQTLSSVNAVLVTQVDRVSAQDMAVLRIKLAEAEASFHMVKNSLCSLVLREHGYDALDQALQGTAGFSAVDGDPVAVAKLLSEFAEEHEGFSFLGGVLRGQEVTADEIQKLAKLPSREVLIAKVVGGIAAPLSGFVGVLSGVQRNLVGVLSAIKEQKES